MSGLTGQVQHATLSDVIAKAPPGTKVQRIWEHWDEVKRLLVVSNGCFTNQQIADKIGCTAQTVSNIRNNPLIQEKIALLQSERDESAVEIGEQVKEIAPAALAFLKSTINMAQDDLDSTMGAPDDKMQDRGLKSSKTVLDHSIPKKVESKVIPGHITLQQINMIKERRMAVEASRQTDVVEAEVIDVQTNDNN